MRRAAAQARELVDRIIITHRTITLGADGPEVVDVQGPALALGHVVPSLKIKDIYHILTPGDEALVFKLLSYPSSPDLLAKGFGYGGLLHLGP
jgi:hypothetical protein